MSLHPAIIESLEEALSRRACPYYKDASTGVCDQGCWEEPACVVDEPEGGWDEEIIRLSREVAHG